VIVYHVTTLDPETGDWTPQIGIPTGPFSRRDMIERIIPALEEMGYPVDPDDLNPDDNRDASGTSPCLNIEIMEVPG
jgi:hypothetical protein